MTGFSRVTRLRILDRDQYMCVLCGTPYHPGFDSIHHRMPRGMGGTKNPAVSSPANGVVLCGSGTTGCHGWIESNRQWARDHGYLLAKHSRDVPSRVPIYLKPADAWCFLEEDGSRLILADKAHMEAYRASA